MKHRKRKQSKSVSIKNRVGIEEKLPIVDLKQRFGDWEMDTITVDNNSEFANHQTLAKKLHTQIYFAHPHSSWEKGLIENTNKLIRQYIPKKSNFNEPNNNVISQIQHRINESPRYKLNFYSPKEIFF